MCSVVLTLPSWTLAFILAVDGMHGSSRTALTFARWCVYLCNLVACPAPSKHADIWSEYCSHASLFFNDGAACLQVDEEVRARENEAGCLAEREFGVNGRMDGIAVGKWGYNK
jgi:hypothetical protein